MDFREWANAFHAWTIETFGPGLMENSLTDHIRSEIVEIAADPSDTEEWVDVALLSMNGAMRAILYRDGEASADLLAGYFTHKLKRNKSRTWLKPVEGEAVRHATEAPDVAPVIEVADFDFAAFIGDLNKWATEIAGPGPRTDSLLKHIESEVVEILADPSDPTEWVDVAMLALDGAVRVGATPQAVVATIEAKFAKNQKRTWPDWRTADPNRALSHIR